MNSLVHYIRVTPKGEEFPISELKTQLNNSRSKILPIIEDNQFIIGSFIVAFNREDFDDHWRTLAPFTPLANEPDFDFLLSRCEFNIIEKYGKEFKYFTNLQFKYSVISVIEYQEYAAELDAKPRNIGLGDIMPEIPISWLNPVNPKMARANNATSLYQVGEFLVQQIGKPEKVNGVKGAKLYNYSARAGKIDRFQFEEIVSPKENKFTRIYNHATYMYDLPQGSA